MAALEQGGPPLSIPHCLSDWAHLAVINTVTNKLVRILGRDENHRFLNIGLYQGMPPKKGLQTIVRRGVGLPPLKAV